MTKIDEEDRQILQALASDGRISNLDLAERVSLSPSATLRRVQALEQSGVIAGYRAMQATPEMRECHNIMGSVDYLLRVEAADLKAYKRFHTDILGSLPQVASITTYVVMGSPKDERT